MPVSPQHDPADFDCAYPYYSGPLGARCTDGSTQFTLWAPTASAVRLRLYATGRGGAAWTTFDLESGDGGSWNVTVAQRLDGTYYDYELDFPDGSSTTSPDPWAKASGANGVRSMVVDLACTDPQGWSRDRSPRIARHSTVVWETHIGDFSNDVHSGVPAEHRGKYAAFCDMGTSVDGAGAFPTGIDYLTYLGVTHIQIMPFYDYGSVDETKPGGYNWGYDPVAYDVPEGSYSSDPDDGACRIRECKAMIQALHQSGFRVIMDVVYNHMYTPDNSFERIAPGYFCRRTASGTLRDGSGCTNDMASEHPMFRRFIVESLQYWVSEYHVDGFRFDLMGLIDVQTMNEARRAINRLPGGNDVLMYGEPWVANEKDTRDVPATLVWGTGLKSLDDGIGWFCDDLRDCIKGSVMDERSHGFVNAGSGGADADDSNTARRLLKILTEPGDAGRQIHYVSAHDDLTLWDKLCLTMRENPTTADFGAQTVLPHQGDARMARGSAISDDASVHDMLAANAIAAGLVFTAPGTPFLLSGEEFARTKFGCDNSFDRSAELNRLDWNRAARLSPLVQWYRRLIILRKRYPALYDAPRTPLHAGDGTLAFAVGQGNETLLVAANASADACEFDIACDAAGLPLAAGRREEADGGTCAGCSTAVGWELLADSAVALRADGVVKSGVCSSGSRSAADHATGSRSVGFRCPGVHQANSGIGSGEVVPDKVAAPAAAIVPAKICSVHMPPRSLCIWRRTA